MIDTRLPSQFANRAGVWFAEPHLKLMAAVLRTVVDDCRGGTVRRRALGQRTALDHQGARKAVAYVASTDRAWPFSFENLCEALGLDARGLRAELNLVERFPHALVPALTNRARTCSPSQEADDSRQRTQVEAARRRQGRRRGGEVEGGRDEPYPSAADGRGVEAVAGRGSCPSS